eukprot:1117777_1
MSVEHKTIQSHRQHNPIHCIWIQVFGCVAKSVLFVCFGLFGAKVMTQVVINTNKRIPIDMDASRRSVLYGIEAFAKKKSLKAIDADSLQKEAVAAPQLSANP